MSRPNNDDFTLPSRRDGSSRGQSSSGVSYIDDSGQIIGELPQGYIVGQQFRVRNTLGEGGMSYVYLCDDISLNRQVALKVMRVSAQSNEQAFMRFHREGQAVAMLSHSNIVKVHSLQFTEHDQPFLVMEAVQGVSLSQLLEISGPLKLPRALKFLIQICDGISHAHANGVIHRDLKLSNIMLINPDRSDELIKILDFGIAKVVNETCVKMTQTGEVFGSPAYMSPEQALGKAVDTKTDQYSLGCIAFELLTGRTPFAAENYLAVLMAHVQEKAPSVNEFMQMPVPANVERAIARLLSKNPDDRFANIDEVKKAFNGELKVPKPLSLNLRKHINFRYVGYVGAFFVCAGIVIALVVITKAPKQTTAVYKADSTSSPENLVSADDMELGEMVQENRYRTTFNNDLDHKNISDEGLASLTFLPNLRVLSLQDCPKITNSGVARIASCHSITTLNLNRTAISDSALASIGLMKPLQVLSLESIDAITDKGISYLTGLNNLHTLCISDNHNLTEDALKSVAKLKSLLVLKIDNDNVTSGLHYLTDRKIRQLSLSGTDANPEHLHALSKMRDLEDLGLEKDIIDEKTLLALAKLPKLKILKVKKISLPQAAIDRFHKNNPNCQLVYDKNLVEKSNAQ